MKTLQLANGESSLDLVDIKLSSDDENSELANGDGISPTNCGPTDLDHSSNEDE